MKTCGIINSIFLNRRFCTHNGENLRSLLENLQCEKIITVSDENNFLPELYRLSEGCDFIAMGFSDSAFYDLPDNKRLMENFIRYSADYGFGENYPEGVLLELVRREALPVMENLRKEKALPVRRSLFTDISLIDINMFDLENQYSSVSLRTLRLSFYEDCIQNCYTINELRSHLPAASGYGKNFFYNDLACALDQNRQLLKTVPRFFEIELSSIRTVPVLFKPECPEQIFFPADQAAGLFSQIADFSPQATLSFSGRGDAANHPDFSLIIKQALALPCHVIVETQCAGTAQLLDILANLDSERLTLILQLDAIKKETYEKIYPQSPLTFEEHLEKIEYVLMRRRKNTWMEIIKTMDNFSDLVDYHNYFKKFTDNIILQKYNTCRGLLPERRLNPMQPFEKIDCWHLKRDFIIRADGSVPVCRQDLENRHLCGNIFKDNIADIFKNSYKYYRQHITGWDYCKTCDEYYTYNA